MHGNGTGMHWVELGRAGTHWEAVDWYCSAPEWNWDVLGHTAMALGYSRMALNVLSCTGTNWSVMLCIGTALGQTGMELKCAGVHWHGTGVHWDGTGAALVCTGVVLGGTVTRLGA